MENTVSSQVMYIPICTDQLKPFTNQFFKSFEDGMTFYDNYAHEVGFDTRKHGTKNFGGVITWQYVVCSREGKKNTIDGDSTNKRRRTSKRCECKAKVALKYVSEGRHVSYIIHQFVEEHNHPIVEVHYKRFMRLNRNTDDVHQKFIVDCAKSNNGLSLTFKLLADLLGGHDAVGCTILEVRNYNRDMKAYIRGSDAQMLLDEMRKKKETCETFSFEFEVDGEDRLKRLFWCDAVSKRNYHMFSDVVAFDTTYYTNRYCMIFALFTGKDNRGRPVMFAAGLLTNEDGESFSWLFSQFLKHVRAPPKLIITDQDLGMKVAIELVLVGTKHHWCMWHIMVKLSDKLLNILLANEDVKKELKSCVLSELIESDEFEESWENMMIRFGLEF